MWIKILFNVITLGVPAIIEAVAKAKRAKREQEARLKKEWTKNKNAKKV